MKLVKLRFADCFWVAAPTVAVVYNVFFAEEDSDTISAAWDRYLARWPWLRPVIHTVAKHLANDLQPWADPISLVFLAAKILRRGRAVAVVVVDD